MIGRSAWILVCLVCLTTAVVAQDSRQFTHPTRGYFLQVPDGTRIERRSQGADVEIRSDDGWAIVIQSQNATATIGVSESAARLEDLYLGPGRPWNRKLDLGASVVAGLPAFDALYDGFGTRFRVVIARGAGSEFLFILRTPPDRFEAAMAGFRALLASFRPGPLDLVANTETFIRTAEVPPPILQARRAPIQIPPEPDRDPAPEPIPDDVVIPTPPVDAPPVGLSVPLFSEARLGYSIEYEPDWVYELPSDVSVMFSGKDDTDAYWATVSIQNVAPPEAESTMHAVSMIVDQLQTQFSVDAPDVVFETAGSYVYKRGDAFLLGREFFAAYDQDGVNYRQWSVVLPRAVGRVAHIWTYRAPAGRFDVYLPVAEAMLRSWKIESEG